MLPRRLALAAALATSLPLRPALAAEAGATAETDTDDPPSGSITIVAPADAAVFAGTLPLLVEIRAEAFGDIGEIELLVDDTVAGICGGSPCDAAIDLAAGPHTIQATLFSPLAAPLDTAAITITVQGPAADTAADTTGATDTGGDDNTSGCACACDPHPAAPAALLLVLLPRRRRPLDGLACSRAPGARQGAHAHLRAW